MRSTTSFTLLIYILVSLSISIHESRAAFTRYVASKVPRPSGHHDSPPPCLNLFVGSPSPTIDGKAASCVALAQVSQDSKQPVGSPEKSREGLDLGLHLGWNEFNAADEGTSTQSSHNKRIEQYSNQESFLKMPPILETIADRGANLKFSALDFLRKEGESETIPKVTESRLMTNEKILRTPPQTTARETFELEDLQKSTAPLGGMTPSQSDTQKKRRYDSDKQISTQYSHSKTIRKCSNSESCPVKPSTSKMNENGGPYLKDPTSGFIRNEGVSETIPKVKGSKFKTNEELLRNPPQTAAPGFKNLQRSTPPFGDMTPSQSDTQKKRPYESTTDAKDKAKAGKIYDAVRALGLSIIETIQPEVKYCRFPDARRTQMKQMTRPHTILATVAYIYARNQYYEDPLYTDKQNLEIALKNAATQLDDFWYQFDKDESNIQLDSNNPFSRISQHEKNSIIITLNTYRFGASHINSISSFLFLKWLQFHFDSIHKQVSQTGMPNKWSPTHLGYLNKSILEIQETNSDASIPITKKSKINACNISGY